MLLEVAAGTIPSVSDDFYRRVSEIIQQDKANRPASPRPQQQLPSSWDTRRLQRTLLVAAGVLLLALAVLYLADYAVLRYRVASNREPCDQVTVHVYYAVGQKNGKTELDFLTPQQVTCVRSLFPHMGMSACWWLRRNPQQRIDIFQH